MQRILSKREKLILFSTIGIVVFSLGFNFIIEPVLSKNASLNKEINITRSKLIKYLQLLGQKEYIQNKYNKFSESFQRYNIGKDTSVNVLSEIENLAKESKIQILDIRPQSPKLIDVYKEALIELRTEGDMESYLRFIYNIENLTSLLTIKSFQLNAKPNSSSLEGNFSISQISLD